MATGFGCMVVGPAGSGKVRRIQLFSKLRTMILVNILLSSLRIRGDA
jgi:hypothetical protein